VKGLRARAGKLLAAGKPRAANEKISEIMKILGVPYVTVAWPRSTSSTPGARCG
jgi:hypothetical protein